MCYQFSAVDYFYFEVGNKKSLFSCRADVAVMNLSLIFLLYRLSRLNLLHALLSPFLLAWEAIRFLLIEFHCSRNVMKHV